MLRVVCCYVEGMLRHETLYALRKATSWSFT